MPIQQNNAVQPYYSTISFQQDIWKKIFSELSSLDLRNVSLVSVEFYKWSGPLIFNGFFVDRSNQKIWKTIFYKLEFKDLRSCSLTNNALHQFIKTSELSKKMVYDGLCFNPSHWNKFFGENTISVEESKEAFESLSDDLVKKQRELLWAPFTITYNDLKLTERFFKNKNTG